MESPSMTVTEIFQRSALEAGWYATADVGVDLPALAVALRELMQNPEPFLSKLSLQDCIEGLRAISLARGFFPRIIESPHVSINEKIALVDATQSLFERWFARNEGFEDVCEMWWDAHCQFIAYSDPYEDEPLRLDPELQPLRPATFKRLSALLALNNRSCQLSALHGMGHLQHPVTEEVIERFIRDTRPDKEMEEYARQCVSGKIL